MALEPGRQLLNYTLVDKLGEGGMGVVWRATDTTLGRDVAIKILPDAFSDDDERLSRFEREARLLASLNHPNIAGVFGLHETEGLRFIAMELVEGDDLAELLRRGPLPIAEALAMARQVAAALAAAHDNGVIHRDLKPANIRITSDGRVKVLDFGLAKAFEAATSSGPHDPALSPTLTSAGTRAGMILGTAAYMSPEQARGKPVDRRADIWAFGCVLFEMLTSRPTFGGDTVTDVLASILKTDPDLSQLEGKVPSRLMRLLERCLEKDAAKRLRDAGDIGLELDAVLAGDLSPRADPAALGGRRTWLAAGAVGLVALLLGVLLGRTVLQGAGAQGGGGIRRVMITTGDGRQIRSASITRDGKMLVMMLDGGAYLRPLDGYALTLVPDSLRMDGWTESPDGQSIAFYTSDDQIMGRGKLRRFSLATGTTVVLRDTPEAMAPLSWNEDGILAAGDRGENVWRVPAGPGEPELLFEVEEGHLHNAQAIPGGRSLLLLVHDSGKEAWILQAVDLETGEKHVVLENAVQAAVTTSGHLVYLRDSTLIGVAFDAERLETYGEPVPILSDVRSFSVADDGTLVYLPADKDAPYSRIARVDDDGGVRILASGNGFHIRISPDGRWVSITKPDSVDLLDTRSGSVRPLRNEGQGFADQVWRPDSRALVYTGFSREGDRCTLFEHPLDGGAPRALYETDGEERQVFPTDYAPDGSGLIFSLYEDKDSDLWWLPADGTDARPLLATEASEDLARISPDGRWVAYESNESGRQEVWVAVLHADEMRLAEKWQVSSEGGKDPLWAPDGSELYYEDFTDTLIGVALEREERSAELRFGERRVVQRLREIDARADGDESYDVAPTGDYMVFVLEGSTGTTELRAVLGWFDELERLVPTTRR